MNDLSKLVAISVLSCSASGLALADSKLTTTTVSSARGATSGFIDYANAKPLPLPQSSMRPSSPFESLQGAQMFRAAAGMSQGGEGHGKTNPMVLVPTSTDKAVAGSTSEPVPQDFGTSNHPFTTSRTNAQGHKTASKFPFRPAGKLFFNIGASTYVCSASLIKPGIIVTAAHCVANYGASQFYSDFVFVPAYDKGAAPYGQATGIPTIMTSYFNGTDGCAVYGVVCPNDVAVITLSSNLGAATGWYGYGWNGYGFSGSLTQVTQLGYPQSLDSGGLQQRTDSYGYVSAPDSNNTVIGSNQTGGSSGGPWLVNLGINPVGYDAGLAANRNVVVGATSWGYNSSAVKEQGASPFTTGNITILVDVVCAGNPGSC